MIDVTHALVALQKQRIAECERHKRELFCLDTRIAALERCNRADILRAIETLSDLGLLPEREWQPASHTLAKLGQIHAVDRERAK